MKHYNLYNPTSAPRVIWDGLANAKPIRVIAGESLDGVALADHVVERLRRSASLGENVELKVTEVKAPVAVKTKRERAA